MFKYFRASNYLDHPKSQLTTSYRLSNKNGHNTLHYETCHRKIIKRELEIERDRLSETQKSKSFYFVGCK